MSHPTLLFDSRDFHALIDGRLDPEHGPELSRRLAAEPETRERIEGWKRQNDALKRQFAGVVLEPVPVRLLPKSLARHTAPGPSGNGARGRPASAQTHAAQGRRPTLDGIGAAVAVFLCGAAATAALESGFFAHIGGGAKSADAVAAPAGRGIAARAAETHQTFATDLNRPVEIPASDEARLLKWIQHRLAMPIRIPDLRPQGWNLIGGRIVPGELGPAAFLVYGNGIERLGLYVARTDASAGDGVSFADAGSGPGSTASWVDEPFGYALTTSRNVAWLERNGVALYDSVRAQARDNASAF